MSEFETKPLYKLLTPPQRLMLDLVYPQHFPPDYGTCHVFAPTECAAVTQLGSMQSHSRLSTLVQCPGASLPISQSYISQVSAVARFMDFQSVEEQTENCSPSRVRLQGLWVHDIAIQQTMEISRSLVA